MAQTKVSELTALTTTDGAEELLINDGGTSKKVTIANLLVDDQVTYAKIQNVSADERILGRVSGADGVIEELTKAQVLTFANVEDGADVTDATNVANAGALMDSELAGIAAVKATTGTFLTADQTKLDGIDTSADVTDATTVAAAGALMDSELAGIAAVKATTGTFLTADQTKLDGIATSANNYTLPEANATTKGGIELFSDTDQSVAATSVSTTAARTYGLQLNSDGQGVVNVPWADTDTVNMGSGFTVSATTDTNATTITQGDDLMFTAGTGITCETTADGTVTITNTVADTTNDVVDDTSPQLGGFLDANGNYMQTEKGADIVSASPLVITTVGDYFDVTGTTNFAVMTVAADRQFTLQFDGVLTMTHHATNIDLPGEANITTAAGDVATFQSTGSNTVQCINYTRADGTAVVGLSGVTLGFYEHTHTISSNLTITTDYNALSAGPITVASGYSVTVPSGSTWVIV